MKFSSTHEWADINDGVASVGISAFAAAEMGDLVYIQLPEKGDRVEIGEPFAEAESVKAVAPINSPVSGEVIEVNSALADNAALINDDAYAAWFVKVKVEKEGDLMSEEDYRASL